MDKHLASPLSAVDLSRFDRCPRLAILARQRSLPRRPLRDALRAYAIPALVEHHDPAGVAAKFLDEAANPGFDYGVGCEPYVLAQDYACWLEGALRYVADLFEGQQERLVFRIDRSDVGLLHWSELLAFCHDDLLTQLELVTVRLPAARDGRLPSPLALAYQHPRNGQLRVARRQGEEPFGKSWPRVGRWERTEISWPEWRRGIELDGAEGLVVQRRRVDRPAEWQIDEARSDLAVAEAALGPGADAELWPRRQEGCEGCAFQGWCHGDDQERGRYPLL